MDGYTLPNMQKSLVMEIAMTEQNRGVQGKKSVGSCNIYHFFKLIIRNIS